MPPRHHTEISLEEALNYEGPNTALMDRYNRIVQAHAIKSMGRLADGLVGVMETIHRGAQLAAEKAEAAMKKADDAIKSADMGAEEQRRQQRAMWWLTAALVACTAVYTVINGIGLYEASRANDIQARIAKATEDQVAIARRVATIVHSLP